MNQKAQAWFWKAGPRKIRAALPKELAVTDSAVYGWLRGHARPSYERAKALVEIAKQDGLNGGNQKKLTIDDFLAPHEGPGPEVTITTHRKKSNG